MSKADDLRKEAKEAGKRGDRSKSLREGATERRREQALNDMADNEDWLDGKPEPKSPNDLEENGPRSSHIWGRELQRGGFTPGSSGANKRSL